MRNLTRKVLLLALLAIAGQAPGADNCICPQYKAMDYGNGTAMFYALRCQDTHASVGYVQLSNGPTFMGCALMGCPGLAKAIAKSGKSPHYDADKDLKKIGAEIPTAAFNQLPSIQGTITNEEFHSPFAIQLMKDDTTPFKHKGNDVFGEAIALKITPNGQTSVFLLPARQVEKVTDPKPAVVIHHGMGDEKFLVHFTCDLPKFPTLQFTGQLILIK